MLVTKIWNGPLLNYSNGSLYWHYSISLNTLFHCRYLLGFFSIVVLTTVVDYCNIKDPRLYSGTKIWNGPNFSDKRGSKLQQCYCSDRPQWSKLLLKNMKKVSTMKLSLLFLSTTCEIQNRYWLSCLTIPWGIAYKYNLRALKKYFLTQKGYPNLRLLNMNVLSIDYKVQSKWDYRSCISLSCDKAQHIS